MPLRFACPQCSQKLSVSSRKAGTTATCPRCKNQIRIPALSEREAAASDASTADRPSPASQLSPAQGEFTEEDGHDLYSQFSLYDDTELVYDTDEPMEEVDANVDYDRVAVPRYVLYVQGALLGAVGLLCFALGVLAGGAVFSRSEPVSPHPVRLTGSVTYARGSRDVADASAVVIAVPQTEQLDERAPIEGLRPDEPMPEPTHRGLEIIRTTGGVYTRADEQGRFELELPSQGRYFVLVLSANARRRGGESPGTEDVLKMGRYFENAGDLLAQNRYQWTAETLLSDKRLNVVFD